MKKIAIFGPINSRGGREIETAFVATVLQEKYNVIIYSTEIINEENDLFIVNPSLVIYKKHKRFINKVKARFGGGLNYKNLNFKKLNGKKNKSLEAVIQEADLVFIIAQLTSNYTKEIILLAEKFKKRVVFRTTGTIPKINLNNVLFNYLQHVDLFINHSESNSLIFKKDTNLNYTIIDQCVFKEEDLLAQQSKEINKIKKFYCASRLDKNKDIKTVIKAFDSLEKETHLELHIIGDGPELKHLKSQTKNKNITFYGHLDYDEMINTISHLDCLIISSIEEAGPYNALEAMLFGKPILSTKVGAMTERFGEQKAIWFEQSNAIELSEKIKEISNYNAQEIKLIQKHYIKLYKTNHSKKTIAKAYLDSVNLHL